MLFGAIRTAYVWLVLVAALVVGGVVDAQETAPAPEIAPILTINQERLFTESLFGERILKEREVASKALAAENRKIEAQLTAEELDLTRKRKTLPAKEFRKLADAFDKKVQEIRRAQDGKARALAVQMDKQRQVFFGKVLPILNELVTDRGAVALLDRRAILVASDSIDITDDALRMIDARIGDGKASEDQ